MKRIGILAYGSLIDDPGEEIKGMLDHIENVETSFKIEFAHARKKISCRCPNIGPR